MIKYNSKNIVKWYHGNQPAVKVIRDNIDCFDNTGGGDSPVPPTPVSCYEVIPTSITAYTSTTYPSVYSYTDGKWYMLNNLNQYEEYGIYETGLSLADFTYYDGKLVVIGSTEYQRSGNTWVEVGTYVDVSVTYTIDNTPPSPYVGQTLSTTFKIPVADIEAKPWFSLGIHTSDGKLEIGRDQYTYWVNNYENGTITSDSEYYYYSLPTTQSIVIGSVEYWNSDPIHLIAGSKQASVEYSAKTAPSSALTYSTVEEMEAVGCPDVGVGQYCYTQGQIYKFTSNDEWVAADYSELSLFTDDNNGDVRIIGCGYNNGVIPSKIAYDSNVVNAYFGNCVTNIGSNLFGGIYDNLTSVSATSVTPPTVNTNSFSSNTKLRIYVPCDLVHDYRSTYGWNNYANLIESSDADCQQVDYKARFYDSSDNLIGELQRSTASTGANITSAETQQYASTAYRVELGDSFVRTQPNVFKGFTHISALTIGDNVLHMNSPLVNGCVSLKNITFPPKYRSYLGENLVTNCMYLNKQITIPSGTTAIYRNAINNCPTLKNITILTPNVLPFWGRSSTSILENTNNCPIYVPQNLVDAYKAASGWSTIASRIQAICIALRLTYSDGEVYEVVSTSTTITGSDIMDGTQDRVNIVSADIYNSVTSIGGWAFYGCSSLTSITIPDSVTSIGGWAFYGCSSLTSITIPDSVTSIGEVSFYGCSGLTSITCNAVVPPTLGSSALRDTNNCPIYVPAASVDAYKTASGWGEHASRIQAIP